MEHEELAVGGPMTHILSYKWSQDHLETFFVLSDPHMEKMIVHKFTSLKHPLKGSSLKMRSKLLVEIATLKIRLN